MTFLLWFVNRFSHRDRFIFYFGSILFRLLSNFSYWIEHLLALVLFIADKLLSLFIQTIFSLRSLNRFAHDCELSQQIKKIDEKIESLKINLNKSQMELFLAVKEIKIYLKSVKTDREELGDLFSSPSSKPITADKSDDSSSPRESPTEPMLPFTTPSCSLMEPKSLRSQPGMLNCGQLQSTVTNIYAEGDASFSLPPSNFGSESLSQSRVWQLPMSQPLMAPAQFSKSSTVFPTSQLLSVPAQAPTDGPNFVEAFRSAAVDNSDVVIDADDVTAIAGAGPTFGATDADGADLIDNIASAAHESNGPKTSALVESLRDTVTAESGAADEPSVTAAAAAAGPLFCVDHVACAPIDADTFVEDAASTSHVGETSVVRTTTTNSKAPDAATNNEAADASTSDNNTSFVELLPLSMSSAKPQQLPPPMAETPSVSRNSSELDPDPNCDASRSAPSVSPTALASLSTSLQRPTDQPGRTHVNAKKKRTRHSARWCSQCMCAQ